MAEKQRTFHIITEMFGVLLGAFLIFVGLYYASLPMIVRFILVVSGIAGMLIDGYCLTTWKRK